MTPSRFAQSRACFAKNSRNETRRALFSRRQPIGFIPRRMNLKGGHRLFQIPRQTVRAIGLHMRLLWLREGVLVTPKGMPQRPMRRFGSGLGKAWLLLWLRLF